MNQLSIGAVVTLRSGGPAMSVTWVNSNNQVTLIYFNQVTGLFEQLETKAEVLREATTAPQTPQDASSLRNQTIARSSLA